MARHATADSLISGLVGGRLKPAPKTDSITECFELAVAWKLELLRVEPFV